MGQLSRVQYRPLLTRIGNRQHASSDDHEEVRPPREVSTFRKPNLPDTGLRSIEVAGPSTYRVPPRLSKGQSRTSPRKFKRKQLEITEVSDSPPKRGKTLEKGGPRLKSKVEWSLSSAVQTEGMMQTETAFDADPISSDGLEQLPIVTGAKRHSNGSTSTITERRSVTSLKSKAAITKTSTTKDGAGRTKKPNDSSFKAIQMPNTLSSRNNNTTSKQKFQSRAPLTNAIGDEELDSSDGEIFANIHANKKRKRGSSTPRSSQTTPGYGKGSRKPKIQTPKYTQPREAPKRIDVPEIVFKRRDLNDLRSSHTTSAADGSFAELDCPLDDSGTALSDVNDGEPELSDGKVECEICRDRVRKMLKEEFEDEILRNKTWSFKWQQRFCTWHKRKTAHEVWRERGYPEIDWENLRQRMQKHDEFLLDVVNDKVDSYHRNRLRDNSRHGRSRQKDDVAAGASKFVVGYYGQRGERQVHEYIMSRFADALRKRSTKDKLILANGIQGGVNGFVQLVLAPHLAELLIKEDFDLTEDGWELRAREVLTASADVGELLFPEEQDKVSENAYQNNTVQEEDDDHHLLDLGSDVDDEGTEEII